MEAVIIDDEPRARSLLRSILEENCEAEVDIIHEAGNLKNGVELIREFEPKLVFLDIEMPKEQGIEILNYFKPQEINFEIIFTTAYSEFALKAFEMNAVSYLLKPLRPSQVQEAVEKVRDQEAQVNINERLEELSQALSKNTFKKIGLPVSDGILLVPIEEIIHIEADGMYTTVYTENDGDLLISKPLKFYEHLLGKEFTFYRPHRSHIFNFKYLKQYVRKNGSHCLMENGNIVPVAREKKDEFVKLLSHI